MQSSPASHIAGVPSRVDVNSTDGNDLLCAFAAVDVVIAENDTIRPCAAIVKKKTTKKKTSASCGRWEQGKMCSMCSILWTCLLSKLARLSASTFLRRASCVALWCFQTVPAKVQNDLIHCILFTSSGGTNSNCIASDISHCVSRFCLIVMEMWPL